MKIKGIQQLSLIDYPGKIVCTIFLFGCNFRCGFCHNPELVLREEGEDFSKEKVLKFLEKRRGKLEGVCITGGEPLLALDENFLREIKAKNYSVKIDTNGCFPKKLKSLIEKNLVDFVAIDIKSSREKYEVVAGVKVDLEKIEESVQIASQVDYELRTTVVKGIHDEEEIKKIGEWAEEILGKPKKFCLQGFKNNGKFIDEKYKEMKDTGEEFLDNLKKVAENYFEKVEVRV